MLNHIRPGRSGIGIVCRGACSTQPITGSAALRPWTAVTEWCWETPSWKKVLNSLILSNNRNKFPGRMFWTHLIPQSQCATTRMHILEVEYGLLLSNLSYNALEWNYSNTNTMDTLKLKEEYYNVMVEESTSSMSLHYPSRGHDGVC